MILNPGGRVLPNLDAIAFGEQTALPTEGRTDPAYYEAIADAINQRSAGKSIEIVPVGTVIYYAGLTAPTNYLACDGTVYNIEDYPDLAQFFADNYGSANYWGGDGTTTFAVPDWQGEFFRASGSNSHANQGSGAEVGTHQDGTEHPSVFAFGNKWVGINTKGTGDVFNAVPDKMDSYIVTDGYVQNSSAEYVNYTVENRTGQYSSRPTNTSLLVCIKAE